MLIQWFTDDYYDARNNIIIEALSLWFHDKGICQFIVCLYVFCYRFFLPSCVEFLFYFLETHSFSSNYVTCITMMRIRIFLLEFWWWFNNNFFYFHFLFLPPQTPKINIEKIENIGCGSVFAKIMLTTRCHIYNATRSGNDIASTNNYNKWKWYKSKWN
jgi:hypothetical protein